ncbi:HAD family hydrolase [Aureimonas frigidaquae]|uniref:HAD-superfamily hydrolase, subfamily IA, variant 3 n=1 Tax=Aureimonas frigidaquae TaxID=424757 RepID=A0A0P0Z297_9HYPH|nr:HAD family phosphatase [Aureimonas frigidaquae]BAT28200.1 HAD-superfamily hydrolase, subfamily IA, variant 3 [Aureimonas frigidaquae]
MTGFGWKGVAWDVDGTLIDSEPLHHAALVDVAAQLGLDLTQLDPMHFVGVHIKDVFLALRDGLPAGLPCAAFEAMVEDAYVRGTDRLAPLDGAAETMLALAACGIGQVCVSNSSRRIVQANLKRLGAQHVVSGLICLDDVAAGKPDPEPYLRGAALLDLAPADVLAVEDSVAGATAALAAGMHVAMIGAPSQAWPKDPRLMPIRRLAEIRHLQPVTAGVA